MLLHKTGWTISFPALKPHNVQLTSDESKESPNSEKYHKSFTGVSQRVPATSIHRNHNLSNGDSPGIVQVSRAGLSTGSVVSLAWVPSVRTACRDDQFF